MRLRRRSYRADDDSVAVTLDVSPDAAQFIRQRGGRLFIWVDHAGLLHKSFQAPENQRNEWTESLAHGIHVSVAASAGEAHFWRVAFRRFPWKQLNVTSDMTMVSGRPTAPAGYALGCASVRE